MRHIINGLGGALIALTITAQAEDDYGVVEERIRSLAPQAETIAISETPIDGVLMVQVMGEIVYATADGKYLIQGRLVDMETREDLTESAKAEQRQKIIADIDPSKQITFAPDNPRYDLMVFTDIDCGYCRKLHQQIAEYNEQGIAIHYLAFPRAGIGSKSYEKAVSVWCAQDPQQAITLAKQGSDPDPAQCDNPVAEQYQLGQALGVTGTPSLVMADGRMLPGYVPPEQLRQRLDQMNAEAVPAE